MTALEKLKEFIETEEYNWLDGKLLSYANRVQSKIISLLEDEKQNIILAYQIGFSDGMSEYTDDVINSDVYKQGLEYYNQTFKENEK